MTLAQALHFILRRLGKLEWVGFAFCGFFAAFILTIFLRCWVSHILAADSREEMMPTWLQRAFVHGGFDFSAPLALIVINHLLTPGCILGRE